MKVKKRRGERTGQHDEDAVLLKDVELGDVRYRDDLNGDLGVVAEVGEVHAVVGAVDHPIPVVCTRSSQLPSPDPHAQAWELAERRRASDPVRADKVASTERASLKDEAAVAQLELTALDLL